MSETNNGNTIWRVDFEDANSQYVIAPNIRAVHTILKRMYRAPQYEFDWEEYELTDLGHTDIEAVARGDEPPFSVLEAKKYHILEHEKRVNQAGYKGMYVRTWNR